MLCSRFSEVVKRMENEKVVYRWLLLFHFKQYFDEVVFPAQCFGDICVLFALKPGWYVFFFKSLTCKTLRNPLDSLKNTKDVFQIKDFILLWAMYIIEHRKMEII